MIDLKELAAKLERWDPYNPTSAGEAMDAADEMILELQLLRRLKDACDYEGICDGAISNVIKEYNNQFGGDEK